MEIGKRAYKKILKEFQKYRRKAVCRLSKEEVFNSCGKIHFYCCVKEYFELNDRIPEAYLNLVLAEDSMIAAMWDMYLKEESLGYLTWDEIDRILEKIFLQRRQPLAG